MRNSRLVAIGFSVLLVVWLLHLTTNHFKQFGSIIGHTAPSTEGPSALVRSLRPSYPFSIIAGGAYSPAELKFANSKDVVVRTHYADFDITKAHAVRLTDDRFQYVSYRLKDQVYWTKKKLRIPSGELLLTDGVQYARARCGNRLSEQPHKNAVSAHEPDSAMLSLPPVSVELLPKLALADPPEHSTVPAAVPLPLQARVAAGPAETAPWPLADQPLVPLVPVWGGQPLAPGDPGVYAPVGAGSSSPPPTTTSTLLPNPPNTPQVPPSAPIPEPGTVYLVLITLLFTGWVLTRLAKSDDQDGVQKR